MSSLRFVDRKAASQQDQDVGDTEVEVEMVLEVEGGSQVKQSFKQVCKHLGIQRANLKEL